MFPATLDTVGEWASLCVIVGAVGGGLMFAVRRLSKSIDDRLSNYLPVTEAEQMNAQRNHIARTLEDERVRIRSELHARIDALDKLNSEQHKLLGESVTDIKQNMALREEQQRIASLVEKLIDLAMHNK